MTKKVVCKPHAAIWSIIKGYTWLNIKVTCQHDLGLNFRLQIKQISQQKILAWYYRLYFQHQVSKLIFVLGYRSPLFQIGWRNFNFQNMVIVLELSPNPCLQSGPIASPMLRPWLLGNWPPPNECLLSQHCSRHFDYLYTNSHTMDSIVEIYADKKVL